MSVIRSYGIFSHIYSPLSGVTAGSYQAIIMQDLPFTGTGVQFLTVGPDEAGQRIDNFLLARTSGVPKSHIYRIIRTGQVRINKGRIKPTYKLQIEDIVRLPPLHQSPKPNITVPDDIVKLLEEAVIFENDKILAVNKPPGLAVHAGSGLQYGVIDAFRQSRSELGTRLELAHRLDRGTSGCLIIGKSKRHTRDIQNLFRENRVGKHYVALVTGHWAADRQCIDQPLIKNVATGGERRVQISADGKTAVSYFSSRELMGNRAGPRAATLMDIQIDTGRTHQIRVHAASAGHAIVGDEKYGHSNDVQSFRQLGLKRLYLHCNEMVIDIEGGLSLKAMPDRTWLATIDKLRS